MTPVQTRREDRLFDIEQELTVLEINRRVAVDECWPTKEIHGAMQQLGRERVRLERRMA